MAWAGHAGVPERGLLPPDHHGGRRGGLALLLHPRLGVLRGVGFRFRFMRWGGVVLDGWVIGAPNTDRPSYMYCVRLPRVQDDGDHGGVRRVHGGDGGGAHHGGVRRVLR